jgi:aspartyl-tRNA(Asn)/glutamyl-tRNA(Gln) amidotransferase subunit B
VQRGIEYEVARHQSVLEDGGRIIQETRGWNDATQSTFTMRVKEQAHDYRYFPDPDLPPLEFSAEWIDKIRATLPELPHPRMRRFIEEFGLSEYDAEVLTTSKVIADYFENAVRHGGDPKPAANWILTELLGLLNENNMELSGCKISAENLGGLLAVIKDGTISGRIAKDVFKEMFDTGRDAREIISSKNLVQVSDETLLADIVAQVIAEHPGPAAEFKSGKEKAIGFLVGQVMKQTQGKANPQLVNKLFREKLSQ